MTDFFSLPAFSYKFCIFTLLRILLEKAEKKLLLVFALSWIVEMDFYALLVES